MKRWCAWMLPGYGTAQEYPAGSTVKLPMPCAADSAAEESARFDREETETWARAVRAARIEPE